MARFSLCFILYNILFNFWIGIGYVEGIVGGTNADKNRHKYVVSVHVQDLYVCGGVVIGEYHVLTAAHCVIDKKGRFINKQFSVLAGVIDTNVKSPHVIKKNVENIYVPSVYKGIIIDLFSEIGDIAVLKLKSGFDLNPNSRVQKVHLPEKNRLTKTPYYRDYVNDVSTVFGFGEHRVLKYAAAVVLGSKECSRMSSYPANEKHICAQINQSDSKFKGTCKDDDGGPLITHENANLSSNSPKKLIVIGILVQSRYDCNEKFGPSLYTRVTSFMDFIDAAIANTRDRNLVRFFSFSSKTSKSGISTIH